MKNRVVSLFLFLFSFGIYLSQASPSVTAGDSGEFITAAATLSLPHAPSFPLYTLTSRVFANAVPWGSIAYKCNVFSALCSAGALLLIFFIGRVRMKDTASAFLVSVVAGLTASFWENSLVTEVFSLNTLIAVSLFWCLTRARDGNPSFYGLYAFLLGLGLGNHHITVLTLPAFAAALWFDPARSSVIRQMGTLIALGTIGFSVYLFLPIRATKEPPLNWGQPATVSKLVRSITRKDYGPLTLALGDAPVRNFSNTQRHLTNFVRHMSHELPWPVLMMGLAGFALGIRRKDAFSMMMLGVFILSGPFFIILGNLPFNTQSDGIIGRFYILPALAFLLGGVIPAHFMAGRHPGMSLAGIQVSPLRQNLGPGQTACRGDAPTHFATAPKWVFISILIVSCWLGLRQSWAQACSHRQGVLVLDYARSMLRLLPPGAALFIDGGDDAFYSLAMLHDAMGKRPDVTLHDRGGLVFKNPYGDDFRSIPKDEKKERRWKIEKEHLARRDVFYSTMDPAALPGVQLRQVGFLMEAESRPGIRAGWPFIVLRSLYPLHPDDYRTRALAAFFPFMRGKQFWMEEKIDQAMASFRKASVVGYDIDWLKSNLGGEYAQLAYAQLMAGNFQLSERIYRQWLEFDPQSEQAQANLGVVLERQGRISEAKEQYHKSARMFPKMADPVFNLAVLAWKEENWPEVVANLEETLRRNPTHTQAGGYLRAARMKLGVRK